MQPHPFWHKKIVIDTLESIKVYGYTLHAYCMTDGCKHHQPLDMDRLIERLGADFKTTNRIQHVLYCSVCRRKNRVGRPIQITLAPAFNTPNDNPFGHLTNPGGD